MYRPLVSVIIPTYNRANTICSAIDSALNQSYSNIEIIVVDDGSTDETFQKLEMYKNKIRVVQQKNSGVSSARNKGIELSRGDIISFLDSDDFWLPSKIERQISVLNCADKSVSCCICNTILLGPDGSKKLSFELADLHPRYEEGLWINVLEVLATRFVIFNQAVTIRRHFLEQIGYFDTDLWVMEDHDLALRLASRGSWAYIKEPLVIYNYLRIDGLSYSAQKGQLVFLKCLERIYTKALNGENVLSPRVSKYFRRNLQRVESRLKAMKVKSNGSCKLSWPGRLERRYDLLKDALFRRSPLYPKMEQVPFVSLAGGQV